MSRENAAAVLAEFGAHCGIPRLAFDATGLSSIGFDDFILNLELAAGGELLSMSVWLDTIGEEQRAEIALRIADANYLLYATRGATLGMSRSGGDVVLVVQVDTGGLSLQSLSQTIENLLNLAETWKQRLTQDNATADRPGPPDQADPEPSPMLRV